MLLKESWRNGFPDVGLEFKDILTLILSKTVKLTNNERPIQKRHLSRT